MINALIIIEVFRGVFLVLWRNHNHLMIITLLLLAPTIPELLTGSTPITRLLNPINLLILISIYGLPALLIREYSVYRCMDYRGIALLGVSVGFLVEGLAVNTLYDPRFETMGDFSRYGRFLGINWNWSIYLLFFHSIYSVAVPIMLTESLFPNKASKTLVDRRLYKYIIAVIAFAAILFNISSDVYKPPIHYQLITLIVAVTYILLIHRVLSKKVLLGRHIFGSIRFPPRLVLFYPIIMIILVFYIMEKILPPIIHIILGFLLYISIINTLPTIDRRGGIDRWYISSRLVLGLCINGLIAAVFDQQYHIIIPAIIYIVLIMFLDKRIRKREEVKNVVV